MAQDIPVYNAMDVSISINGRVIQGFQENDMFSAQYKEDQVRTNVDAQGWPSMAINNNHLGQITLNLSGSSLDYKTMLTLANTHEVFSVVAITPIEKITANQCIIARQPSAAYGKDTPKRTFTIEALDMQMEPK